MRPRSVRLRVEELENRLVPSAPSSAPPLGAPPSPGPNVIWVDTVTELQDAVRNVQSGQTIVIQRGTYNLTQSLYVGLNGQVSNVTIRGETENYDDVVIRGKGMENADFGGVPHGFSFYNAQDVTVANLSIGDVYFHPIDLQGSAGADRIHIYHARIFDGGEQLIKSNPGGPGVGADDVIIEYSVVEYTAGPPVTDHGGGTGYTQGISAHDVENWIIRHNLFRNFHTPDTVDGWYNPVVLMWNHSSGTIVEGNTFINSDRAIAFGLWDNTGNDHQGGIIRNNFIYVEPGLFSEARRAGADGQILVYDSPDTKVYHNTVITNGNTPLSIEVRWATSGVEFRNNLTDAPLGTRNGGVFGASGNYLTASSSMFVDAAAGDYHLVSNSATQANVIDKVSALATSDWDGDARPIGSDADIGADEHGTALPPPELPTVTLTATDASAAEPGTNKGKFRVTRTGSTDAALTVNYAVSGTATNGTDYNQLTGAVTIAAGATFATITVAPKDDTLLEGSEKVILSLTGNGSYTVGTAKTATVTIADNDAIIRDNGQPGYSEVGTWFDWADGYNGTSRYADPEAGAMAVWTVAGLAPGTYRVQLTWPAGTASGVAFRIYDGTTQRRTGKVNQQNEPTGTLVNGRRFQTLGTVQVTNGTLRLELDSNVSGWVIADAIRIVRV